MSNPVVAILMGSKSDFSVVQGAIDIFKKFDIEFEAQVLSAHRTPIEAVNYASTAKDRGIKVIICAAGMAAHLGGVIASHTTLPVVGIPVASEPFNGIDALLSIVQMPPGIPVAAVTAGKAGGKNSALYAISILALGCEEIDKKLQEYRKEQTAQVLEANQALQNEL